MPLQQTSGNVTADAYGGGVAAVPNYIEEVFSTYLVTGDGSAPAVNNGIDVSGKGGLVWTKKRSAAGSHSLFDTARGANLRLISNDTAAQDSVNLSFTSTGFSNYTFDSGVTYATWTFRNQPKFFQCLTYTGNGTNGRTVAHSLGSVPGCMIIKRTDASNGWAVYHRSMNASPQDYMMRLNADSAAFTTSPSRWNNTLPTATEFTLSGNDEVNGSGATYVAYLFAHNAGGFGLTGTDNVISCGTFDANNNEVIDLGYEPQWLLYKPSGDVGNWRMVDNMRGFTNLPGTNAYTTQQLLPNSSNAEASNSGPVLTSTGFTWNQSGGGIKHIYIAIRRGPMKVPTDATKVFSPVAYTGTGATRTITAGFPVDLAIPKLRNAATNGAEWYTRLIGPNIALLSAYTAGELARPNELTSFASNTGVVLGDSSTSGGTNASGSTYVDWNFGRAPNFFDEVCYTSDGTYAVQNHNLGVVPQLVILKQRNATGNWNAYTGTQLGYLELTDAFFSFSRTLTSTTFQPASAASGGTFVAYLFATCAGVSKVGSYTGNGSTQTIDCGFGAGGARFVLIKRTDSTGDWYVYDTARGMTVLTDPYLRFNSTGAEVATLGSVTTVSTGFAVNASILAAINTNAASYIFLAIA